MCIRLGGKRSISAQNVNMLGQYGCCWSLHCCWPDTTNRVYASPREEKHWRMWRKLPSRVPAKIAGLMEVAAVVNHEDCPMLLTTLFGAGPSTDKWTSKQHQCIHIYIHLCWMEFSICMDIILQQVTNRTVLYVFATCNWPDQRQFKLVLRSWRQ